MDWELTNFEHLRIDFSAIRIPRKDAEHLLSELAGKPKKRAGRPSGPSNPWEKEQVAAALRMIDRGDTRSVTAIALVLTDSALTGSKLQSQQRRLAWGIKRALDAEAKNSVQNKRD
ncbi:hypothetical protein [Sphingopyxis sp. LK2115]|jgi:hypothetical protein|uniref:hypothetical protein n=1 Tax=Sphingopyxis sp. LK2115 TaxID=2744558 RepID=UPI00166070EC|nr:hypothetical protein [Sphingopyxis sp. LK2115]